MLKSTNGQSNSKVRIHLTASFAIVSVSLTLLCLSCAGSRLHRTEKSIRSVLGEEAFQNHHHGLLVLNAVSGDTIIDQSSDKYFVPASNVKIATLYAALQYIPEQLPIISYAESGDSLFIRGLGNPASLHPKFKDSTLLKFLDRYPVIFYNDANYKDEPWAPGWAWEDFDRSFSAERNSLPLYGNVVTITGDQDQEVSPNIFRDSVIPKNSDYSRSPDQNLFYVERGSNDTLEIPFRTGPELTAHLLSDELKKPVHYRADFPEQAELMILSGYPRDTVIQEMMIESDNFLAEQLLILASAALADTLMIDNTIEKLKSVLFRKGDPLPRWVDGSGLSRYNLFTPASIVGILNKLYQGYNWDYLQGFFPIGGQSGTLREEFQSASEPFIFAKSGSMGNIYCLSGFLETDSGKVLIFSFMNNNFNGDQRSTIKTEMNRIFEMLRKIN